MTVDAGYDALAARFRPLFAEIAEGESARERERRPPHAQLRRLVDAGFAGLRVPAAHGGADAALSHVIRLMSELAEADPNLAHVWRNHVSFVEDRRHDADDPRSAGWLRRLAAGEIVGGGWSEPATSGAPALQTTIVERDGRWTLSGTKYYATGSVYARWSTVLARDPSGERVVALIPTDAAGVRIGDDWDGFGQRLTGSGSVTYDDVTVDPARVFAYAVRYPYQEQYYQSTLNALLVGIGRAVLRDGVAALRARSRSHGHALVADPRTDPELLEVIGAVSADVYGAEAALLRSLALLDTVAEVPRASAADLTTTWIATSAAQLVIGEAVLRAATTVFDALGSSGTSATHALDRHWRNARTLLSHNPRVYKRRMLGDWHVSEADPARG
ncbi:MAG: acyl-CoA dehydrogenase family protein [Microbacterium sp.]